MKPASDDHLDPVAAYLDESLEPESAIHRVWQGVEGGREEPPRRSRLLAVAVAAAVILGVGVAQTRTGPLELADGSAIVAAERGAEGEAQTLHFDDGSTVELRAGARVVPTRNDGGTVRFDLDRGSARFSVRPGGSRAWEVRTERLEVRVIGTEFIVDAESSEVHVERGRVEVRNRMTGELRVLSAGDTWGFTEPVAERVAEPEVPPEVAPPEVPAQAPSRAMPREEPVQTPDWRVLAEAGEHEAAFEALEHAPPETVADRMLAVDTARRAGHLDDAVERLRTILEEFPSDEATPLAALTLGRIERRRGRYAAAVEAFERAKSLGVPASFSDEVCAELALARHREGDHQRARIEAAECVGISPDSPFAASLRPLLRGE